MKLPKSFVLTIVFALVAFATPATGLADQGDPLHAQAHIAKTHADMYVMQVAIATDLHQIQSDLHAGHHALQSDWHQLHSDWNTRHSVVQADWQQLHADWHTANGHGPAAQIAHAMHNTQAALHTELDHALVAAHQVAHTLHTSLTLQGHHIDVTGQ